MGALELSPLRLPTLHSGSSPALPCTRTFNFWEIFKHAFQIYSIWPQAHKHITNALLQRSSTSVGLIQARPNPPHDSKTSSDITTCHLVAISNYMITSKYTLTFVVYISHTSAQTSVWPSSLKEAFVMVM